MCVSGDRRCAWFSLRMNNHKSYTTGQVAELMGVSRRHVNRLIEGGKLNGFNVSPEGQQKRYRVPAVSLEAYMAEQAVDPAPAAIHTPSAGCEDYLRGVG